MKSNSDQILLQLSDSILEQQRIISELARNDLLLIESLRGEASTEVLAVAAATVRATLYSVDALSDKLRQFSAQLQER